MSRNSEMFQCETCGMIEFMVTVEPNYPIDEEKRDWLDECSFCPNCGESVEKV